VRGPPGPGGGGDGDPPVGVRNCCGPDQALVTVPLVTVSVGRTVAVVVLLIGLVGVGLPMTTWGCGVLKLAVVDHGPVILPFRAWTETRTRQWNSSS